MNNEGATMIEEIKLICAVPGCIVFFVGTGFAVLWVFCTLDKILTLLKTQEKRAKKAAKKAGGAR